MKVGEALEVNLPGAESTKQYKVFLGTAANPIFDLSHRLGDKSLHLSLGQY